jgi:hypothetical protein
MPKQGRAIKCSHCSRVFHGRGTSRVFRSVLFHFCAKCWLTRRAAYEAQAVAVAS